MNTEYTVIETQTQVRTLMNKVYGWMSLALGVTAFIAYFVAGSPSIMRVLIGNKILFFGLIIAEFLLVGSLVVAVQKMRASTATLVFFGYAALNGLTLSTIFLMFTSASIASTFFITAGMFGATSVYGYVTKRDLTSFGGFLTMGLIGIILASVVNIFLKNSTLYWMVTYIGVFVFVGLTAYDTQKIKNLCLAGDEEVERKTAVIGALTLYLDFINLFLMLLRIFGRRQGSWE